MMKMVTVMVINMAMPVMVAMIKMEMVAMIKMTVIKMVAMIFLLDNVCGKIHEHVRPSRGRRH